ncbi:MAG TPA: guanylate kinase [Thermodesulfobacteriota bacterium]|nr:guanylate kinase [Thermodesulfobacteriota bacterium]
METGLLFIVSGPSGTGKSTLCKDLMNLIPDIQFSVSYTTRLPRKDERPDEAYHFVSRETFTAMIDKGEFAEWAEIYGHLYGTPRSVIEQTLRKGNDLLFDIDGQGSQQLKKNYPRAITIFVIPPSIADLEKRLQKRETDSSTVIQERVAKACAEIAQARDYAYIIINDIYAQALQALHSIVLAEKHRGKRMKKYLTNFGKPR